MEDGNGYTSEAINGYRALLATLTLDQLFELSHNVHEDLQALVVEAISEQLLA